MIGSKANPHTTKINSTRTLNSNFCHFLTGMRRRLALILPRTSVPFQRGVLPLLRSPAFCWSVSPLVPDSSANAVVLRITESISIASAFFEQLLIFFQKCDCDAMFICECRSVYVYSCAQNFTGHNDLS